MSPIANMNEVRFESFANNLRIFVGGLNQNTTKEALEKYFSAYGTPTEVKIEIDFSTSKSKGYGIISFSSEEDIDKVQASRPHFIEGTNISSFRYVPKEQDRNDIFGPRAQCRKLFVAVARLNEDTDEQLSTYFSKFGNVIGVERPAEKKYVFVEFDDYDAVDKCILHKNHAIGEQELDVKKAVVKPGAKDERKGNAKKVFVGPLHDGLTDELLSNYFSQFGKVVRVERPKDKETGNRRDFGFINFEYVGAVDRCLEESSQHTIEGKKVQVKKVLNREDTSRFPAGSHMLNQSAIWNPANLNFGGRGGFMMGQGPMGLGQFNQAFYDYNSQGYGFPAKMNSPMMGPMKTEKGHPDRFKPYDRSVPDSSMRNAKPDQLSPYHILTREGYDTENLIRSYFSNFGTVLNVEWPYDKVNRRKRDYVFVEFADSSSATICMKIQSESVHQIAGINVIVRKGSIKGADSSEDYKMARKIFVDLKGGSKAN